MLSVTRSRLIFHMLMLAMLPLRRHADIAAFAYTPRFSRCCTLMPLMFFFFRDIDAAAFLLSSSHALRFTMMLFAMLC